MKERPPLFSWDLFCTFMNVLKAEMAVEMGQNRHLFCFLYFRNCSVCVYLSTLQYGTTKSINNVLSASKLKIKFHLRFWCHLQLAVDNTRIKPFSTYVRMFWTNLWQPTAHVKQNIFEQSLMELGSLRLYASFGTFVVQIGQLFEA